MWSLYLQAHREEKLSNYHLRLSVIGLDSAHVLRPARHTQRLKHLEEENRKLKRIVADQVLDLVMLKDLVSKKW